MNKFLNIEADGIPFAVDDKLQQLIADSQGGKYALYEIESIVGRLRRTLTPGVCRVELYGAPPERLYMKMQSESHIWEEAWLLQFEHAGVQLSRAMS